jgi:hypothetical protein
VLLRDVVIVRHYCCMAVLLCGASAARPCYCNNGAVVTRRWCYATLLLQQWRCG